MSAFASERHTTACYGDLNNRFGRGDEPRTLVQSEGRFTGLARVGSMERSNLGDDCQQMCVRNSIRQDVRVTSHTPAYRSVCSTSMLNPESAIVDYGLAKLRGLRNQAEGQMRLRIVDDFVSFLSTILSRRLLICRIQVCSNPGFACVRLLSHAADVIMRKRTPLRSRGLFSAVVRRQHGEAEIQRPGIVARELAEFLERHVPDLPGGGT